MRLNFSGQQALSRKYAHEAKWESTPENPLKYSLEYKVAPKPFSFPIAGLKGSNPTVGAFEYFDSENDQYLSERWPAYLEIKGWVNFPDEWVKEHTALNLLRVLLWRVMKDPPSIFSDQQVMQIGYRREIYHVPSVDIVGKPRPVPSDHFNPADIGEPVGPGFVSFDNSQFLDFKSQVVWSEFIKFPNRTDYLSDKHAIDLLVDAHTRRFNSHSELRDSKKYIQAEDRKGAVRAAASAVDACLNHLIEVHKIQMPSDKVLGGFDKKIEQALKLAGLPPFTRLEPEHARNILYLYRARSKMHEGDCYYKDNGGYRVNINRIEQVKPLVESAHAFIFWMDTVL